MNSETWAQVSNALVYSTIIVLAVALVAFAADLALGLASARRATEAAQSGTAAFGSVRRRGGTAKFRPSAR